MFKFKSDFKLVHCPFNPQHIIIDNRLQAHILKCMKNYPDHFRCPYNALHCFLKEEDLAKHIFECPNKVYSEPWKYQSLPEKHGDVSETQIHFNVPKSEGDEDWDREYL